MGRAVGLGFAIGLALMTSGCVMPMIDGTGRFMMSGAGRPSEAQINNAFAFHRGEPSYLREFYNPANDPRYDTATLGTRRVRY
jgi:hypothetical protein